MSSQRLVVVHPDAETLAEGIAARLLTRLLDLQSQHAPVHVSLTGGTLGIALLEAANRSPLRNAVDWSQVHLWWGDDRYLPAGDQDRNDTQARNALLDSLVADGLLPEANIHAMPAAVEGVSPDDAALEYAATLEEFAAGVDGDGVGPAIDADLLVPEFDIMILGMGPDAHIASLFPHHAGLNADGTTVGIYGSPKPPALRVSLTFAAIQASREVWMVASGDGKAAAVALALGGAAREDAPAAAAIGQRMTLWLIDAAASSAL